MWFMERHAPPPSLLHGPGRFGAVVVADGSPIDVRAAARDLLTPLDARVVVGVSHDALHETALATVLVDAPFRDTPFPVGRPGLFVQLATASADERDALVAHARRSIARQGLVVVESHALAAIEPGPREPFGFLDPFRPRHIDEAVVDEGKAVGASVLVALAFVQDTRRFATLAVHAQERVMGVEKANGHVVEDAPASAHVTRMRAGDYRLVRRGLPFEDRRGMFFVAHAREGDALGRALRQIARGDAMMAYTWPTFGATFVTVPTSDALAPENTRESTNASLVDSRGVTAAPPADEKTSHPPSSTARPSRPPSADRLPMSQAGSPAQERS
jgi:hypothetical protein